MILILFFSSNPSSQLSRDNVTSLSLITRITLITNFTKPWFCGLQLQELTLQSLLFIHVKQIQITCVTFYFYFVIICMSSSLFIATWTLSLGPNKANRHKPRAPSQKRPTDGPTNRPTGKAA